MGDYFMDFTDPTIQQGQLHNVSGFFGDYLDNLVIEGQRSYGGEPEYLGTSPAASCPQVSNKTPQAPSRQNLGLSEQLLHEQGNHEGCGFPGQYARSHSQYHLRERISQGTLLAS